MTRTERELLENYVASGKLMQLATLTGQGSPVLCHVWYRASFAPDRLYFISRKDRAHSVNIRRTAAVAGGIVAIDLEGLGQRVRGVTFEGKARELPTVGIDTEIASFVQRWPNAASALDVHQLANDQTSTRMYEVSVESWILFDEENFPDDPRRNIAAAIDPTPSPA